MIISNCKSDIVCIYNFHIFSLSITCIRFNATSSEKVFIVNPSAKGVLKTTEKSTGTAKYLMEGNELDGYKVLTSNSVAKALQVGADEAGVVFGAFNDYVIGQWGGIDLTVDPYTQAANGKVRLVINAYFDAKPRRAASFVTASVK